MGLFLCSPAQCGFRSGGGELDDAYLAGERLGGKAGRGSEIKIPIVAAVSLNEAGHPTHARITAVSGFSSGAIADWAKRHLSPGSKHPNELPQFRWINTLLGNVKTSFTGTFHAFHFDQYARRNLGGYCFRFNRRFSMAAMTRCIPNPVRCCRQTTEHNPIGAEAYGSHIRRYFGTTSAYCVSA